LIDTGVSWSASVHWSRHVQWLYLYMRSR